MSSILRCRLIKSRVRAGSSLRCELHDVLNLLLFHLQENNVLASSNFEISVELQIFDVEMMTNNINTYKVWKESDTIQQKVDISSFKM